MKARRNTTQRAIVAEVAKTLYHPSAEEVYEEVKKRDKGVGRATVFRNLNLLAEEGSFFKVFLNGEPVRYDTNPVRHDHFLCTVCGEITDLPPETFSETDEETEELSRQGYKVESKSVAYYGVCRKCRR